MIVPNNPPPALLALDLDGTLLNSNQRVSDTDWHMLERLGQAGVVRVIATGRSLWSAMQVIDKTLPIDYLAFSSGVGIIDWCTRELVSAHALNRDALTSIIARLIHWGCDFMVQNAAPNTHEFCYHRSSHPGTNPDFERRLERYGQYARPLDSAPEGDPHQSHLPLDSSHVVVVQPPHGGVQMWQRAQAKFKGLHVVRTTSPVDGTSVWIELFNADVSKSNACAWLASQRGVGMHQTAAVGNDYNDTDLLEWAANSYVVANSPAELRARFVTVASNDECGVSEAVSHWQTALKTKATPMV